MSKGNGEVRKTGGCLFIETETKIISLYKALSHIDIASIRCLCITDA